MRAQIVSANLSDYMKEAQSEPITSDELLLEWALENVGRPAETPSAQYVRADGALVYAIPLSNQLALLASDGSIALIEDDVNAPTRTTFSPDGIRRYRRPHQIELAEVIDRVYKLLTAHVRFAADWQPMLISLWVVGTYVHALFEFFGYLHITSASKRCGKSLLLDLLSHLCFNATRITTNPTPAVLFRDAERNCGTQLFDEVESLSDADRTGRGILTAMLNAGFKRGSRVARIMNVRTDSVREFNVYAPRVVAGIRNLSATLADRCLRIELVRKSHSDILKKFSPRREESNLAWLRDDLHMVGLQNAKEIAAWYERAEELRIPEQADDRLRDILEPLFAIATVADIEQGSIVRVESMISAARAFVSLRVEDDQE
jgi:hypothetical protein